MINKDLYNFSIKLLKKDKSSHIFSIFIFTFIVFTLSSILFISSSIKYDLKNAINTQNEIIIYNQKAGNLTQIDDNYLDDILQITGVSNVYGKIDGYYYFDTANKYFHIISSNDISEDKMIIGNGIQEILNKYYYKEFFNFYANNKKYKINIQKILTQNTNIISNDVMILNKDIASEILQFQEDEYSYLEVQIPNDSEIDYIAQIIHEKFPNLIIKTKEQNLKDLENIFYYKGGIFMIVYIVTLISFFILLYKQISSIDSTQKKQISILRSFGFTINNIIQIKFIQNFIVAIFSYVIAICLAYIYVFIIDAPLLKNIFVGDISNISFTPVVDINILLIIFIFTVIPFLLCSIIPSWKVAISDINEAMK